MRKTLLHLVAFLLFYVYSNAQEYQGQKNQVFAYNILSNGLMAGIGGLINKSEKERKLKAFSKNFLKGCFGGMVKYSAKSQVYYLSNPDLTFLVPFNRLYYFAGHSIVMNASLNKNFYDTYYFNMYGFDIRLKTNREAESRFQSRLSVATAASVGYFLLKKNKLDFYKTLEYGLFYFDFDNTYQTSLGGPDFRVTGQAGVNTMVIAGTNSTYRTTIIGDQVLPHELVHTYQFYDFYPIASFYDKTLKPHYEDKKWYQNLGKFLYLDYQSVYYSLSYLLQPDGLNHYANFHEFEAQHFSSRKYIRRSAN